MVAAAQNHLSIPQDRYGTNGIKVGNTIYEVLYNTEKWHRRNNCGKASYEARYDLSTDRVVVLNSSDLPPNILKQILDTGNYLLEGRLPTVCPERDPSGNLLVQLTIGHYVPSASDLFA